MDTSTKLRLISYLEWLSPVRALKLKSYVIYHAFDQEIAQAKAAKNHEEIHRIEQNRHWEMDEFSDRIVAIRSMRLMNQANDLYIHFPDLQWETGNYGDRYLDRPSLSKLYLAVKEQKDKNREYWLKLAGVLIGIIGALTGLVAVWHKSRM